MPDSPPSSPPSAAATTAAAADASCPFCTIAKAYQPISPLSPSSPAWDPNHLSPPTYVALSTSSVIAFLDIAPLTRGHLLVAPRTHSTKLGDLRPSQSSDLGLVLPLLVRAVTGVVLPDIPHDEVDYNVVQNNGPGAAQVIPHVHFHVIPRPPLNYQLPTEGHGRRKYPPNKVPTGLQQSYVQFGRGSRNELDDEDAVELVRLIRSRVKQEWEREFGNTTDHSSSSTTTTGSAGDSSSSDSSSSSGSGNVPSQFTGGPEDAAWIEGSGGLVTNLLRRSGGGGRTGKL